MPVSVSASDLAIASKDSEIRALTLERDRALRDLSRLRDELSDALGRLSTLRDERENERTVLRAHEKSLRALEKENAQLKVMVDVHRDTNSEMHAFIETLAAKTNGTAAPGAAALWSPPLQPRSGSAPNAAMHDADVDDGNSSD
jgi:predicted  nucleic acid-binding Zn-ribbon protein